MHLTQINLYSVDPSLVLGPSSPSGSASSIYIIFPSQQHLSLFFFVSRNLGPRMASFVRSSPFERLFALATACDQDKIVRLKATKDQNVKAKMPQFSLPRQYATVDRIQRRELAVLESFRLCLEQANGKPSTMEHHAPHWKIGEEISRQHAQHAKR